MGPRDSYICLIPKPLDTVPSFTDDDLDTDVTPARSWSLLQPLTGTCLYVRCHLPSESRSITILTLLSQQHRQGWFTYSYCHNDEIRQFKEVFPSQQVRLAGKILIFSIISPRFCFIYFSSPTMMRFFGLLFHPTPFSFEILSAQLSPFCMISFFLPRSYQILFVIFMYFRSQEE